MKFHIDVRVTGFARITVEAQTLEKAKDMVREKVMQYKVCDLQQKEMQCTDLNEDAKND